VTPRQQRMTLVAGVVAAVAVAGFLALRAFQNNVMFYFDPTRVANGEVRAGQRFRLGGMVVKGSLARTAGTTDVDFVVTDYRHELPVHYSGVLPDLFKEGTGMVADGQIDHTGRFIATEVLAKHDENYMPPALSKSLAAGQAAAPGAAQSPGTPQPASDPPGTTR
jgi:cytochrome c-type biogenesis protein CcmE